MDKVLYYHTVNPTWELGYYTDTVLSIPAYKVSNPCNLVCTFNIPILKRKHKGIEEGYSVTIHASMDGEILGSKTVSGKSNFPHRVELIIPAIDKLVCGCKDVRISLFRETPNDDPEGEYHSRVILTKLLLVERKL